jgi:hypothetical protein
MAEEWNFCARKEPNWRSAHFGDIEKAKPGSHPVNRT